MTTPTHLLSVNTLDKRGIIAGLSAVLDAAGADLLELSQTVVRDYFTIIVIAALPGDCDGDALIERVRAVVSPGASVELLPYQPAARPPAAGGERYILTASGQEGRGVVHMISSLIAERGGNFTDLDCRVDGAGQMRILAEIDLPREVALDQLQIDLEHAGGEVGLQVRLQHEALFIATNEVAYRRLRP